MFDCNNDGRDHINVYSQGRTQLGVFLSNWYRYPMILGDLGRFESVEGLWYYLSRRDERLRNMSGYAAKRLGSSLPKVATLSDEMFKEIIKMALKKKVAGGPFYFQFVNSVLPFDHYYLFNTRQVDAENKWLIEYLEELRSELKNNLNKGSIKNL